MTAPRHLRFRFSNGKRARPIQRRHIARLAELNRKIPVLEHPRIARLYRDEKLTAKTVADRYGVTAQCIINILDAQGVPLRRGRPRRPAKRVLGIDRRGRRNFGYLAAIAARRLDPLQEACACAVYLAGFSLRDMKPQFGVSTTTLANILARRGVRRREAPPQFRAAA